MDYLEAFAAYLRTTGRAPATQRAYLTDLRQFRLWFEQTNRQPFAPQQVTAGDIRRYVAFLERERGVLPASLKRRLAALAVFFAWSVQQGWRPDNPARGLRVAKAQPVAPRWLSKTEQRVLLRTLESDIQVAHWRYRQRRVTRRRDATLVLLLLHTGLRVNELTHLKMDDLTLNPRSGWLRVRTGKGDKFRTVPLNAPAREALQAWLAVRPTHAGDYLFTTVEHPSNEPLSSRTVQRIVKRLGRLAGLPHLTPHMLRHTFAKNLVDAGVSLEKIATLLGHSSLNTTRTYITPGPEDLARAVGQLAGPLG